MCNCSTISNSNSPVVRELPLLGIAYLEERQRAGWNCYKYLAGNLNGEGGRCRLKSRRRSRNVQYPSSSNGGKRKLGKVEQEIYNLLPFLLSCIVFPREYFATREPASLSFSLSLCYEKGAAAFKMATPADGILSTRGTIISGR